MKHFGVQWELQRIICTERSGTPLANLRRSQPLKKAKYTSKHRRSRADKTLERNWSSQSKEFIKHKNKHFMSFELFWCFCFNVDNICFSAGYKNRLFIFSISFKTQYRTANLFNVKISDIYLQCLIAVGKKISFYAMHLIMIYECILKINAQSELWLTHWWTKNRGISWIKIIVRLHLITTKVVFFSVPYPLSSNFYYFSQ